MHKRNSFCAVFKIMILLSVAISGGAWALGPDNFVCANSFVGIDPEGSCSSFDEGDPPLDVTRCFTGECGLAPGANQMYMFGNDTGRVRAFVDVGKHDIFSLQEPPNFEIQLYWERLYQTPNSPVSFTISHDLVELHTPEVTRLTDIEFPPSAYSRIEVRVHDPDSNIGYSISFIIKEPLIYSLIRR